MNEADRSHVDHAPAGNEPRQGLTRQLPPGTTIFAVEDVVRYVARAFGFRIETLKGKRRTRDVAEARDAAIYLLHGHTRMGWERMAEAVGRADHSTALIACRRAEKRREDDTWFRDVTDRLERELELKAKGEAAA